MNGDSAGAVKRITEDDFSSDSYRELLGQLFGRESVDRKLKYTRWLCAQNPFLPPGADLPVYVYWVEGRPVGQICVIPLELVVEGTVLKAGWLVDGHIIPEWQRRGVGSEVHRAMVKDFRPLLALGVNEKSVRHLTKLGWKSSSSLTRYKRLSLKPGIIHRAILLKAGLNKAAKVKKPRFPETQESLGIRCDRIASIQDVGAIPECQVPNATVVKSYISRTSEFIRWRYLMNPFVQYGIYRLRTAAGAEAYAIWRLETTGAWTKAVLVHLLYATGFSKADMTDTGRALLRIAGATGAEMFECQTTDSDLLRALPGGPLKRIEPGTRFMYSFGAGDDTHLSSEELRLYAGDCDVDAVTTWRSSP